MTTGGLPPAADRVADLAHDGAGLACVETALGRQGEQPLGLITALPEHPEFSRPLDEVAMVDVAAEAAGLLGYEVV